MEFKGTKGKWKLNQNIHVWCNGTKVSDCSNTTQSTVYRTKGFDEMKANALLISKAPEMLEMLKYFVENNMLSAHGDELAEQLIKEATEI